MRAPNSSNALKRDLVRQNAAGAGSENGDFGYSVVVIRFVALGAIIAGGRLVIELEIVTTVVPARSSFGTKKAELERIDSLVKLFIYSELQHKLTGTIVNIGQKTLSITVDECYRYQLPITYEG